jgi:hypothetical protein
MPGPALDEKTAIKTAIAVPFLVLLLGQTNFQIQEISKIKTG